MSELPHALSGCEVLPPLGDETSVEQAPLTMRQEASASKKSQAGKRFHEVNAFCDATLRALGRAEIAIWILLWRDTRPSGVARASQADLARRSGVNERTVRRALKLLQRKGLLTLVRRGRLGVGASIYRIQPTPP